MTTKYSRRQCGVIYRSHSILLFLFLIHCTSIFIFFLSMPSPIDSVFFFLIIVFFGGVGGLGRVIWSGPTHSFLFFLVMQFRFFCLFVLFKLTTNHFVFFSIVSSSLYLFFQLQNYKTQLQNHEN